MAELVVRSSGLGEGWCLVVMAFEVPAGHEECGDSVADRRAELFGRSCAHVAGGEHAGDGGFHGGTGDQKSAGIAAHCSAQEGAVGLQPDEHKDRRGREPAGRAVIAVAGHDRGER